MSDIRRFSEQVIDLAERLANVADAAQGKDMRSGTLKARWLVLPAAGAGLYALATSGAFRRQAKDVVNEAKSRATGLPDELLTRVQEAGSSANGPSKRRPSTSTSSNRRSGQRKSKARSSS